MDVGLWKTSSPSVVDVIEMLQNGVAKVAPTTLPCDKLVNAKELCQKVN